MESQWPRYAILLGFGFAAQLLLPHFWSVFAYADFFLLVAVHAACVMSGSAALLFGFTAGVVQDATFSSAFPFGIQAFAKMTVVYFGLLLGRRLNLGHPALQESFVFGASLFNLMVVSFFFVIFGKPTPIHDFLPILFCGAVNAFLNLPFWALSSRRSLA